MLNAELPGAESADGHGDMEYFHYRAVKCTSRSMFFFEAIRTEWSNLLYEYFQLPEVSVVAREFVSSADAYARGPAAPGGSGRRAATRLQLEICKWCLFFSSNVHTRTWRLFSCP